MAGAAGLRTGGRNSVVAGNTRGRRERDGTNSIFRRPQNSDRANARDQMAFDPNNPDAAFGEPGGRKGLQGGEYYDDDYYGESNESDGAWRNEPDENGIQSMFKPTWQDDAIFKNPKYSTISSDGDVIPRMGRFKRQSKAAKPA